jgi:hypothetical protein
VIFPCLNSPSACPSVVGRAGIKRNCLFDKPAIGCNDLGTARRSPGIPTAPARPEVYPGHRSGPSQGNDHVAVAGALEPPRRRPVRRLLGWAAVSPTTHQGDVRPCCSAMALQ